MSIEMWLFVFAFIQTICSVFAGLQFFGITPNHLAVPMKGKAWLVIMLFLWLGGLGFTGYGIYELRYKSSEITSLQEDKNSLTSENNDLRVKVAATPTATQDYKKFASDKHETISRKSYTNEAVEVDGKTFINCRFTNVTFIHHGLAETTIVEPFFAGTINMQTDNAAAKGYMVLTTFLRNLPNVKSFTIGEKDQSGNTRIIFQEERVEITDPDQRKGKK